METRYTVRQAVEMTGVKSLCPALLGGGTGATDSDSNELGHRYYTPDMIFSFS
ncbi:MAG: hypothetical protein ACLRIP_09425 [Blautia massiliensis (ex Durand et al. 2017)]